MAHALGNKPTLGKVQLKPSITGSLGLWFLICYTSSEITLDKKLLRGSFQLDIHHIFLLSIVVFVPIE